MTTKEALILVDYQNDFCHPKGSLYVKYSEHLQAGIIKKIDEFKKANKLVIASKDWHPADHSSFKIWPPHAIIDTWGAEMPFNEKVFDKIIYKGMQPEYDSYSAFINDNNESNGLHEYLQQHHIQKVVIIGIATDVCVSYTLQHAIELGYEIELDLKLCLGMEQKILLQPIQKRFK